MTSTNGNFVLVGCNQYLGYFSLQRVATNGFYLLTLLTNKIQLYLSVQIKATNAHASNNNSQEDKQSKQCLTTGEACHSTDSIFFDSDSDLLYLDACTTDSMSPCMADFIAGTFVPISYCPDVKGSGGALQIKGYGTVRYSVTSDGGHSHVLEISDTAFILSLDYRLFAPQYLKTIERLQVLADDNEEFATGFSVGEEFSTLRYNGGKHKHNIRHIPSARVPAMLINLGTGSYQAFCTEINKIFPHPKPECYAMPT